MSLVLDGSNGVTFPNGSNPQAAPSKVLQVVSFTLNTAFTSTSTTYVDTGIDATITPLFSTSKILIIADVFASTTNSFQAQLYRNSTPINTSTVSATNDCSFGQIISNNTNVLSIAHTYLDSPATTSSITYSVYAKTDTGTFYVNRRGYDTFIGATSTITLMEIAA